MILITHMIPKKNERPNNNTPPPQTMACLVQSVETFNNISVISWPKDNNINRYKSNTPPTHVYMVSKVATLST